MNPIELTSLVGLIIVLVVLAGFFAGRQFRVLRVLRDNPTSSADESRYLRRQVFRRLACSALMVVFAGLLVGWFFLESQYREVAEQVQARRALQPPAEPTEDQRQFLRLFIAYWTTALLVLLALVIIAAVDVWAIARFGLGQHRKLLADHRTSMAEQADRHRGLRNGFH